MVWIKGLFPVWRILHQSLRQHPFEWSAAMLVSAASLVQSVQSPQESGEKFKTSSLRIDRLSQNGLLLYTVYVDKAQTLKANKEN